MKTLILGILLSDTQLRLKDIQSSNNNLSVVCRLLRSSPSCVELWERCPPQPLCILRFLRGVG